MTDLNPAQKAEMDHLKRMVHIREYEELLSHPDAKHNLYYARSDLKKFTSQLRKAGLNI
jgi:hypothetical protein